MRISFQWTDYQVCSQCGAWVWVESRDLFTKEGAPYYRCCNCEREVPFTESHLHIIPPFVREMMRERDTPGRMLED